MIQRLDFACFYHMKRSQSTEYSWTQTAYQEYKRKSYHRMFATELQKKKDNIIERTGK